MDKFIIKDKTESNKHMIRGLDLDLPLWDAIPHADEYSYKLRDFLFDNLDDVVLRGGIDEIQSAIYWTLTKL